MWFGITMAQTNDSICGKRMNEAQSYLSGRFHPYDPAKAFELFKQCALEGNARAMNAVGNMYQSGSGMAANDSEAFNWFEKAANAGYPKAWYNLGICYKYATGTAQDFVKSYECFKKAADLGIIGGMLYQGAQLYKGLGCTQDYAQAFSLFQKGAAKGNPGCMYMLGLCYRNGYGTDRDTVTSGQWLSRAAAKGYKQAKDELASDNPEKVIVHTQPNKLKSAHIDTIQLPKTYRKVRNNAVENNISGNYSGYLITYDWSGKNVVQQAPLKVSLSVKGNKVTGKWIEADTLEANIEATLTDTSVCFTNMQYHRTDHYHRIVPIVWTFKRANIEIVKTDSAVYLAGNLYFYLPQLMEPSKPMYVSLSSSKNIQSQSSLTEKREKSALSDTTSSENKEGLVTDLVAYPNPFARELSIAFTLTKPANLRAEIFDQEGKPIYQTVFDGLSAGRQVKTLALNAPAGPYIIKIVSGSIVQTIMVVKQ